MSADPKTASRLENILAMLSSPNDGERANAALMATRMLKELGLDWRAFTRRALAKAEAAKPEAEIGRYLELLQWDGLTEWERGFVLSLYDRHPKRLTEKQRWHLWKIIRKYEASRCAA